MSKRTMFCCIFAAALAMSLTPAFAQQPTDSAAQASPTTSLPKAAPADDAATEASPVAESHDHAVGVAKATGFAVHTALPVRLTEAIDSGHLKNGETISATLASPVKLASGATLPTGTQAKLTVIATVPAGKLGAVGEMSLQLMSIGKTQVFTDTLTYRGKAGHKDLPDSAPESGTDAGLAAGSSLTFHVQPQPTMAAGPPSGTHQGLVNGVSSGATSPKKTPSGTPPQ